MIAGKSFFAGLVLTISFAVIAIAEDPPAAEPKGTKDGDLWLHDDSDDTGNTFKGKGGNDFIQAGGGDDVIKAGSGDDTIIPGPGHDNSDGGKGDDSFAFGLGDAENGLQGPEIANGGPGLDTAKFTYLPQICRVGPFHYMATDPANIQTIELIDIEVIIITNPDGTEEELDPNLIPPCQ